MRKTLLSLVSLFLVTLPNVGFTEGTAQFKQSTFQFKIPALAEFNLDLKSLLKPETIGPNPLSWSTSAAKPVWLELKNEEGKLVGTPRNDQAGVYTFLLIVNDGDPNAVKKGNRSGSARIELTVFPIPEWIDKPIKIGTIDEGQALNYDLNKKVKISNPGTVVFEWDDLTTKPDWMELSSSGFLTGIPQRKDVKHYDNIKIRVRLGDDGVAPNTVEVTVLKVPKPPRWKNNPEILPNATEDIAYSENLLNHVNNPEGVTLNFKPLDRGNLSWLELDGSILKGTPRRPNVDKTLTIKMEVSGTIDGKLYTDVADLKITAIRVNKPPQWSSQLIDLGELAVHKLLSKDLKAFVTDIDNDILSFRIVSEPKWAALSVQGLLTGTPHLPNVGVTDWVVEAKDSEFAVTTTVRIKVVNQAPVWNPNPFNLGTLIEDKNVSVDLKTFAKDPDGDVLNFEKVLGPDWIHISADGMLTGTPKFGDVGSFAVIVRASDTLLSAEGTGQGTVKMKNYPPIVHSNALQFRVNERELRTFQLRDKIYTEDPNGDVLDFKVVSFKPFATLSTTGELKLAPKHADVNATPWELSFEVSDGEFKVPGKILVTVLRDPQDPVWKTPIKFTARALKTFTASLKDKVTELDGMPLIFFRQTGSGWVEVKNDGTLTGVPQDSDVGSNSLVVIARNDGAQSAAEVIIDVTPSNKCPKWSANLIQLALATAGKPYSHDISVFASDEDQETLKFKKVSGADWIVVSDTGKMTASPKPEHSGPQSFTVEVSDLECSAQATFKFDVNNLPTWKEEPIKLADATEDSSYAFDLKDKAEDLDGDTLVFTMLNGPDWLQVARDGKLGGIPRNKDIGNYAAVFAVTDGKSTPVQVAALGRVLKKNNPPIPHPEKLVFTVIEHETRVVNLNDPQYFTEIDGEPLKFKNIDTLAWVSLTQIGSLTMKPGHPEIGNHIYKIEVSDGVNTVPAEIKIIVIRDPNAKPIWKEDPIRYQAQATVPFTADLKLKVTDPDNVPLKFRKVKGPTWADVSVDGVITGTPQDSDSGENTFVMAAANDINETTVGVIITVKPAHKPFWTQNPIQLTDAKIKKTYTETVAPFAKDDLNHELTFEKIQGPDWVFVTSKGIVIGTPQLSDEGVTSLVVRATDTVKAFADVTVNIKVVGNQAPQWKNNPIALGEIPVWSNYQRDISGLAFDPDGDQLTFRKIEGPLWLKLSTAGLLNGIPQETDIGDFVATFEVSDGSKTATVAAFGKVVPPNKPPTIFSELLVFTVKEGTTFNENLNQPKYVVDPEGDVPLKFAITNIQPWLKISDDGALEIKPLKPQIGQHLFNLKVTDSKGNFSYAFMRVIVIENPNPPIWSEPTIRYTAKVDQFFTANLLLKITDPLGTGTKFASSNLPAWLGLTVPGILSGTPKKEHLGDNIFKVTASNASSSADVTVIVTVKPSEPKEEEWKIDEAVPGALADNLWVIDNPVNCSGSGPLISEMKRTIHHYFNALEAAQVRHVGAMISADVQKTDGKIVIDPSTKDKLFGWDDSDLLASFKRRTDATKTNACYNSSIWSMYRHYQRLPSETDIYQKRYFLPQVPMDVMIMTSRDDFFKAYSKNTSVASWGVAAFADFFIDFHRKAQKSYRINIDPPPDLIGDGDVIVPVAENPYRVLAQRTGGSYYIYDQNHPMVDTWRDYAAKVIFRAYMHAKNKLKLKQTPEVDSIEVWIGGVKISGNTGAVSDQWRYNPATNEIWIFWEKIDQSKLKPGDKIVVKYRS